MIIERNDIHLTTTKEAEEEEEEEKGGNCVK